MTDVFTPVSSPPYVVAPFFISRTEPFLRTTAFANLFFNRTLGFFISFDLCGVKPLLDMIFPPISRLPSASSSGATAIRCSRVYFCCLSKRLRSRCESARSYSSFSYDDCLGWFGLPRMASSWARKVCSCLSTWRSAPFSYFWRRSCVMIKTKSEFQKHSQNNCCAKVKK